VKGDLHGGIETALDDIIQENANSQPEPRTVYGPFRLEGDDGAARIVHGCCAMLFSKIGSNTVQVVCAEMHERIPRTRKVDHVLVIAGLTPTKYPY